MIKMRLTSLVTDKKAADSQEGRVGLNWRGAEPLKTKAFRKWLAPCMQLQNAGSALSVTWVRQWKGNSLISNTPSV